jgi:iron complex outermembrane receptor protein
MIWHVPLAELGKLTNTFTGTYLSHYKYAVAKGDPLVDQAGTFGGPADALPRFRGNVASTWTSGPWSYTARVNYVRGWYAGAGGTPEQGGRCFFTANQLLTPDCRVKPWTTVDMGLVYTGIRNLSLGLQVRNVANTKAPFDPNFEVTTAQGFNSEFHNALGRYYTVNVSYRFL